MGLGCFLQTQTCMHSDVEHHSRLACLAQLQQWIGDGILDESMFERINPNRVLCKVFELTKYSFFVQQV